MPTLSNLPDNFETIVSEFSIPEHAWTKADIKCTECQSESTWLARIGLDTYYFECADCGYHVEE